MKKLLLGQVSILVISLVGCSTFDGLVSSRGPGYRDSALSNPNPAPASLTPPDYTQSTVSPVMDATYLTSQADYHFTMGETLSFEGRSSSAVEEYKTTLIYDPKSVHVRLRLAAEYVRMGMVTEAVEQGEIAIEMAPDSVEPRMLMGGLYSGLKMFEPARKQFAEVLRIQPGHAEASIYSGALLAEEKKFDEAIVYFDALAKNKEFQDPERAHFYIGRVRVEQGESHYAQAEQAFQQALRLRPEFPEAAMSLALVLRTQKKHAEVEKLLKSYQEKFGPQHDMARTLSQYYLEEENYLKALEQLEVVEAFERDNLNIKIQISLLLIEQKKFEQAATRLEDVLLQAPESDKVRYYLGAVYQEMDRPQLSLSHFKQIPPTSPYFPESVVQSAQMLKASGRGDDALEHVERSIKARDDIPQLYAFYATLLDERKAFKKALAMLKVAVEKFPTNTQLNFFLGTIHDRLGSTTETIAQMRKVLEVDGEHVQALNYLAYTFAEMGSNLDEAYAFAQQALKLQPNDPYILDTIGWIYFKRDDTETAIKYLEAAHKANGDEAIIAEHLGDAYLRHQMWQKAQTMYKRAAALETDTDQNRKIMEKLANVKTQNQGVTRRAPASLPEPSSP